MTTKSQSRHRPQSHLQILQSKTTWLSHYYLHKLSSSQIPFGLMISPRLLRAVHSYNGAVVELRAALKESYTATKEVLLAARKKEIDKPPEK